MKIANVFLLVCCLTFAVAGCGGKKENTLANENLTADDFAKYEADLAAANGEGTYDDEEE